MRDTANFRYEDTDDRLISLHDCRADQVMVCDGILSFTFPDGIWLVPGHPQNPTEDAVRSGLAQVDFPLLCGNPDDVSILVFRKQWLGLRLCQEWTLDKLMDSLNHKKAELEFIIGYDTYLGRLYECCLWQKRRPYHRDCQLRLTVNQPVYRWNEI